MVGAFRFSQILELKGTQGTLRSFVGHAIARGLVISDQTGQCVYTHISYIYVYKFESRTVPFHSSESAQGPYSAETAAAVHQLYAIHPGYNR